MLGFAVSPCGLSETILRSQRVAFPAVYETKKFIAVLKDGEVGSVA
jgi:hypothetical protein